MDHQPGIAHRGRPVHEPQQGAAAAAGEGEVVMKKRVLKHVKQQVTALLCGEDLPEGAEAREVAEVPYLLPAVARDVTKCPICERKFPNHHKLMKTMGVHRGEKFPCKKCGKVLASQ